MNYDELVGHLDSNRSMGQTCSQVLSGSIRLPDFFPWSPHVSSWFYQLNLNFYQVLSSKKGWTPQDEVLSCYGPSNRGRMCSGPLPSFSNWCRASSSSCWEPRVRPARTGEWKLVERCRGAGHGNGWIDRRQWKWRCFCYVISYIIWII